MSVIRPSPAKVEELRRRWEGEEHRLRSIAVSLRRGEDWTVHLRGLPFVGEIPPRPGEALGRDLRGADLGRHLFPEVHLDLARETEAGLVAAISLEALQTSTPLPDVTPIPAHTAGAEEVRLAIRRRERFLLARCGRDPVGVVRVASRQEFEREAGVRPYAEVSGLGVLPPWRRAGVGGRLLAGAEERARRDGLRVALLRTTLEIGLVPWYERCGYGVALTRQLAYPGAPALLDVVMVKPLVPRGDGHRPPSRLQRART